VRPGDTIHATVSVVTIDEARARAVLATTCRVGNTIVIDGEASVMTTSPDPPVGAPTKPAQAPCLKKQHSVGSNPNARPVAAPP
jgi:3-hydroxybutyryl-CoA dehydratase